MDMAELEKMFASMLEPLMKRLEEVEKLAAEGRDDERKVEGETEAAEVVVEVPDDNLDELLEHVEMVPRADVDVEDEDESESEMGYMMKYKEAMARLAELEKASVMAEAQTAKLREELDLRDAKAVVAEDVANKPHLSQMSERLVNIYRKDRDLYNEVVSVAGGETVKSVLSQRVTSGFSEVQKPKDPYAAAHDIADSQGITYRQALEGLLKS
jgi:hypothetical protein